MKVSGSILLITVFLLGLVPVCRAGTGRGVVIVQSSLIAPYEEARLGFLRKIGSLAPVKGVKRVSSYADISRFVLSEEPDLDAVKRKIIQEDPDLILAIGAKSLALARQFIDRPVIHLMIPCRGGNHRKASNITGICMDLSPARQLAALRGALPAIRRLGVVYDPGRSAGLLKKTGLAAVDLGIDLVVGRVENGREMTEVLGTMAGRIDALWLLPDRTVVTPQGLEYIFNIMLEQHKPVLAFSEKYLRMGAAAAITFDVSAMGEQAGELAREILSSRAGGRTMAIPGVPQQARKVKVVINRKVAAKLGLEINQKGVAD